MTRHSSFLCFLPRPLIHGPNVSASEYTAQRGQVEYEYFLWLQLAYTARTVHLSCLDQHMDHIRTFISLPNHHDHHHVLLHSLALILFLTPPPPHPHSRHKVESDLNMYLIRMLTLPEHVSNQNVPFTAQSKPAVVYSQTVYKSCICKNSIYSRVEQSYVMHIYEGVEYSNQSKVSDVWTHAEQLSLPPAAAECK